MTKFKSLSAFLVLFSTLLLTSCTTETIDSDLINQDVEDNGGTPGGGNNGGGNNGGSNGGGDNGGNNGGGTGGSTDGSYWPMAINNTWSYEVSNSTPYSLKIIATESIGGNIYYKLDNLFGMSDNGSVSGTGTGWVRRVNGDYRMRVKAATTTGADISATEYSLTKDNVPVNGTWTENFVQTVTYNIPGMPPIEMPITVQGTIMEKDITYQVGSQTFNNVIHSKIVHSTMGTTTTTHYYFAKNVGPVKIQMSGGANQTQQLTSYVLN
jgi:hypothetical protein